MVSFLIAFFVEIVDSCVMVNDPSPVPDFRKNGDSRTEPNDKGRSPLAILAVEMLNPSFLVCQKNTVTVWAKYTNRVMAKPWIFDDI